MRIAIIAPPFIRVPPRQYGGTELFIAQLAEGLQQQGLDVVVYTNSESTVGVERRWLYEREQWPLEGEVYDNLKDINHTTWAVADAAPDCQVIHLNNVAGLAASRFVSTPLVYTMHHPHIDALSRFFSFFPQAQYVTISDFQRKQEKMPNVRTIHHGIDLARYRCQEKKEAYLSFIGRIAPVKGVHTAIEVAKRSGIPLKIAGEVQPVFREYFDYQIKPHIDGRFIEYLGVADLEAKNELLGGSLAMLFPVEWDEPFGLVMIEAMACGTPVLAFARGSVPEVVKDGLSGYVCRTADDMAQKVRDLRLDASTVRAYVEQHFSIDRMVDEYAALYRQIGEGPGEQKDGEVRAIA